MSERDSLPLRNFLAAAFLNTLFLTWIYFPGLMSPDTIAQLAQGREFTFTDWHPPLLSLLLGLLGPGVVLLLQAALFSWGLAFVFWRSGLKSQKALLALIAIYALPPLVGIAGTLWKDVWFGVLLIAVAAIIAGPKSRRAKTCVLLLCLAATMVRHNGIVAVIPFVFWVADRKSQSVLWRLTLTIAIAIGLFALSGMINRLLCGGKTSYPLQQILVHDLAGISEQTQLPLVPRSHTRSGLTYGAEELKKHYTPERVEPLFCCPEDPFAFTLNFNEAEYRALKQQWAKTVASYPRQYLHHRFRTFSHLVGYKREGVCQPLPWGIAENSFGYAFQPSRLSLFVHEILEKTQNSLLFRQGFYLILLTLTLLILAFQAIRQRSVRYGTAMILAGSGALYGWSYLFIATACDFRLMWWSDLALILSWVLIVASRSLGSTARSS